MDRIYADADSSEKNEERPDQQTEQPTPAVAEMPDWLKICQEMWTRGCISEEDWKWMEQVFNEYCKALFND